MNLPAYPKYKNSGVAWLGMVPEGWEVKRLKYLCSCNDESLPEITQDDYYFEYVDISSVSHINGIEQKEEMFFGDAPSRARRIVKKGDCLVSTVRTYLKAIVSIDFNVQNLIVSTGFAVLRPKEEYSSSYLKYYSTSSFFIGEICSRSTGVS